MKIAIRTLAALALTVVTMAASVAQPVPEKRVALLIGNDTYPGVDGLALVNIPRDLYLLEASFRRAGFEVDSARNLSRASARETLQAFARKARDADAAVIYFTGAGMEVDGVNYFAPTEFNDDVFNLEQPTPVELEATMVPVSEFITAVQPARRFSLVMSDSGRMNPWMRSTRGALVVPRTLAEVAADSDVLVFYASGPAVGSLDGPPGGNGPFAAAVAKHMVEENLEIGLFVRRVRAMVRQTTADAQRPALYGQLSDSEFYFVGGPPPRPAPLILTDQPRLALVIGNSDYNKDGDLNDDRESAAVREQGFAPDLPNPANDGRDIKVSLERMKFQVDLVENADYETLLNALFAFETKVVEAGEDAIVIVYYAGHAIQVGGANFLVPVNAKLPAIDLDRLTGPQAELALQRYALPLQTSLLERLKNPSSRGLNLVILDACRENPWQRGGATRTVGGRTVGGGSGRTRGLGEVRIDLRRTAIAYATKPGDVADDGAGVNSPYTSALKAFIEEPGVSVIELLNRVGERVEKDTEGGQVPWTNTPALGRTCLGVCAISQ